MLFKSSSLVFLLLLLFCCINVSTARNLRKPQQQKLPDHGMMESDSSFDEEPQLQKDGYDMKENNNFGNDEESEKEVLDTDDEDQLNSHNDGYGNDIPAQKLGDHGIMDDSPSDDHKKQAHGRFRRTVKSCTYDSYGKKTCEDVDEGTAIAGWLLGLLISLGILFCICLPCIIIIVLLTRR